MCQNSTHFLNGSRVRCQGRRLIFLRLETRYVFLNFLKIVLQRYIVYFSDRLFPSWPSFIRRSRTAVTGIRGQRKAVAMESRSSTGKEMNFLLFFWGKLPFTRLYGFQAEEFAIIDDVRFELHPVRLCCLKLKQINPKTNRQTGVHYVIR